LAQKIGPKKLAPKNWPKKLATKKGSTELRNPS
jgi:hypothetical protein